MAVEWVRECFDERTSDKSREFLARTYVRKFRIKMSDQRDGPRGARLALRDHVDFQIEIGQPYPSADYTGGHLGDAYAVVRDIRVRHVESSNTLFEANVEYATLPMSGGVPGTPDVTNPLDRAYEYRWATNSYMDPIDKTIESTPKPIQTLAKEPYDPSVEREMTRLSLTVTRNESHTLSEGHRLFSVSDISLYKDSVNLVAWIAGGETWQPKTVRMIGITADKLYEYGLWYWRVTYQLAFNADTWVKSILHQGIYQLEAPFHTSRIRCKDDEGGKAVVPMLLDGAGAQLVSGDPVFHDFDVYKTMAFDGLELGA